MSRQIWSVDTAPRTTRGALTVSQLTAKVMKFGNLLQFAIENGHWSFIYHSKKREKLQFANCFPLPFTREYAIPKQRMPGRKSSDHWLISGSSHLHHQRSGRHHSSGYRGSCPPQSMEKSGTVTVTAVVSTSRPTVNLQKYPKMGGMVLECRSGIGGYGVLDWV